MQPRAPPPSPSGATAKSLERSCRARARRSILFLARIPELRTGASAPLDPFFLCARSHGRELSHRRARREYLCASPPSLRYPNRIVFSFWRCRASTRRSLDVGSDDGVAATAALVSINERVSCVNGRPRRRRVDTHERGHARTGGIPLSRCRRRWPRRAVGVGAETTRRRTVAKECSISRENHRSDSAREKVGREDEARRNDRMRALMQMNGANNRSEILGVSAQLENLCPLRCIEERAWPWLRTGRSSTADVDG